MSWRRCQLTALESIGEQRRIPVITASTDLARDRLVFAPLAKPGGTITAPVPVGLGPPAKVILRYVIAPPPRLLCSIGFASF